jgi:hypothetical protein
MLGSTRWTPEASKSSMKPTAVEERFYARADHRSKRTRFGFESLLVRIDVVVEVLLEQLVKRASLGLSRAIEKRSRPALRPGYQLHASW